LAIFFDNVGDEGCGNGLESEFFGQALTAWPTVTYEKTSRSCFSGKCSRKNVQKKVKKNVDTPLPV
jgi:hypothetical protein